MVLILNENAAQLLQLENNFLLHPLLQVSKSSHQFYVSLNTAWCCYLGIKLVTVALTAKFCTYFTENGICYLLCEVALCVESNDMKGIDSR